MSKRTLILIGLLIIITTGLVLIALYSPYSPPVSPSTSTIVPTVTVPVEQTILSFDDPFMATESAVQNSASNAAGTVYSLPLVISTGKNAVTAVQVELGFDPEVLTNVTVDNGSFFNNPLTLLNDVDEKTGKISYAVGISPQDSGLRGEGIVAIINFQAKIAKPEATNITFLPKTLVTAEGVSQSVLKSTAPAQFIVGKNVTYSQ